MKSKSKHMKIRTLLILLLICLITSLYASLNFPSYKKSNPPKLSLPDAYKRAVLALGETTNQFHCVSANVTTKFTPEGEWYFTFYSTNSTSKLIAVEFSGKVIFDNGYR
jgi:hypothetical protein